MNSSALSSKALIIYSTVLGRELPLICCFYFKYRIFSSPGFLIFPLPYPLTLVHFFLHLLRILNTLALQSFSSCSSIFFSSGGSLSPVDCFCWQSFFILVFLFLSCSLSTEMCIFFGNVATSFHFPFSRVVSLFSWGGGMEYRVRAQVLETICVQVLAP